jgi:photosystem II stability/assembly factor-like uncharacterized protein
LDCGLHVELAFMLLSRIKRNERVFRRSTQDGTLASNRSLGVLGWACAEDLHERPGPARLGGGHGGGLTIRLLPAFALALAPVVAGGQAAPAPKNRWISIGPYGVATSIRAVAIDPSAPATVYAAASDGQFTIGGVFRSLDHGSTWVRSSSGLTGGPVYAIAVDPASPATLYACDSGQVSRTDDRAATWRSVASGLPDYACSTVAVAAGAPSTVWITGRGGVFKTTDGGAGWSPAGDGLPANAIVDLAIDPSTPSTLYAAAENGDNTGGEARGGVFKSTDSGATWTAQTSGIGNPPVRKIAISPSDPRTLYASTYAGPIYRSNDGSASWAPTATGAYTAALAVDPRSSSVVYVAGGTGLLKTTDGGASWNDTSSGLPGDFVSSIAIDPVSPSVLYAGLSAFCCISLAAPPSGVYRTDDAGSSWRAVNQGLTAAKISALGVDPASSSGVYAGLWNAGIYQTKDGGLSWNGPTQDPALTIVNAFAFDPTRPGVIYAATYDREVLKTTDGGSSWNGASQGIDIHTLGLTQVPALAIDARSPTTLYAGVTGCFYSGCSGAVFKTTDGAASWTRLWSGPAAAIAALGLAPSSPSTVYAGTGFFAYPQIFKTGDGGASWTTLQGFPSAPVASIGVAPDAASTVYAAAGGLYRSRDGGGSWSPSSSGIPPGTGITSLAIDPLSADVLYAGTTIGVYRSADGGDAWWPLNDGLTNLSVSALALDPTDTTLLYAGTNGGGVFRMRLANGNAGLCSPSPSALCLGGDRFRVEVSWSAAGSGSGAGQAAPITANTGAFWFFSPDNLELVIKVLDGRAVNGSWWVFYGALSNVEYTITVTDTETGAVRTYFNPQGTLASVADTSAF